VRFRGIRAVATALTVGALAALSACSGAGVGIGPGRPEIGAQPVTGEVLGTGPVKVALLLPLSATGNAGQIAQNLKNAADLAIRDFQTANIQILVKDDGGTSEGARAAASQAISQGAELILGPLFAQSVTAAAAVARSANVPVVAFSTDATAASRGVYLLSFLPQSDVDRIISFAAGRGKRSFAALLPNTAEGTLYEAALQRAVANGGGRVMTVERYDLDKVSMQTHATAVATLVNSGTVDAVFMPDAGDAAPFLSQVLAANGVLSSKITFLGSGQWDDPRIAGESNLNGGWYPAPDNTGFAGFAQRYQAAFGAAPSRTATLAYDATSLAAGLAARFGAERFSAQVLTNPSGFIGIDGAFRFLQNGLCERGLAIYQIEAGKTLVIDPAPKTFARAPAT
jgi:ABC-type branched-subunit amino acid transport system substrate-binding protein